METKDKEIKANVLKDIFHGDQYLNILNEDDKEWLMQLAEEGNIHAIYCLIDGMQHQYRSWTEPFIDEDTNKEVEIERNEMIDGTTFVQEAGEMERLTQMLYDAKGQMSDDELKRVCLLDIDTTPLLLERIRRGDDEAAFWIEKPTVLLDLCEKGNKDAARQLGYLYDRGDEEQGIFKNPEIAQEYFKMAGEEYEYEPEEDDPHEADYFLKGSAQELSAVKTLVDELARQYGDVGNECGLYIPLGVVMNVLVGSPYYEGNLLTMNTNNPECIVLHAEANRCEPLLYALREAFPYLSIEMREAEF